MLGFRELLAKRDARPIRVALVGATYMGSGVLNAVKNAVGIDAVAVYDENETAAAEAAAAYAPHARVVGLDELCRDPAVEVVVDGTSSPSLGARAAILAIDNGKHLVSVNIECDATVGHVLAARARKREVVYTTTAGDEPGELKALYDHYDALGFHIAALGKGKSNPLDPEATPDDVRAKLPDNGITAEQVTSFVDGSKTMFEMGCIGNAVGLGPDACGMHGPECTLAEIPRRFRKRDLGGILSQEGVVDFVTGQEISGGIWIVVYTNDARVRSDFGYLKMGHGPYYLFYQRYHNWFADTPLSVLRAALVGMGTVVPRESPTCRVVAVAKRRLGTGQKLDGIGGYDTYGRLEREDRGEDMLPLGLAEGAETAREIGNGDAIRLADVELPGGEILHGLWADGASACAYSKKES